MSVPDEGYFRNVSCTLNLFVGGFEFYLFYFCLFAHRGAEHILTILATWLVSYKRQELLTLREHPVFSGIRLACLFRFLCCPIMCLYVLTSVLWCPLWFPQCSVRLYLLLFVDSCLIYIICVSLRIVVSYTCYFVLLFCLSCVVYAANISGLSIFDWIYNYLCNQCLLPLKLWVQIPLRRGVPYSIEHQGRLRFDKLGLR